MRQSFDTFTSRIVGKHAHIFATNDEPTLTWLSLGAMVLTIAIPTVIFWPLREFLGVMNLMPLYLLISLALGLMFSSSIATIGAVISFVVFDLIFVPPYYTITIASRDHAFTLVAYMVTALVAAHLMVRLRDRTREAVREQRRTALLYELNRGLVRDATEESLLHTIASSVVEIYGARACRVLAPTSTDEKFEMLAGWPEGISVELDRDERSVATMALEKRAPMGLGGLTARIVTPHRHGKKPTRPRPRRAHEILWVPIVSVDRRLGLLEVHGRPRGGPFADADTELLFAFADQAALAIERTRLMREAGKVEALQQSDALKSSLLSAVSHDLRTPLTSIKAAASGLLDDSVEWTDDDRRVLLQTIDEEADRLTRMVSNLLDLSRIEAGVLKPDRDWHDLNELISDVISRVPGADRRVTTLLASNMPLAYIDYVKISQVLENLIGNALKFAPGDSAVEVSSEFTNGVFEIRVKDHGPGIDPASLPHIFDRFYRAKSVMHIGGSGIGLSVARGFVEAHHGTMAVESRYHEGATFTVRLPQEDPAS